jgi:hypothetical protein
LPDVNSLVELDDDIKAFELGQLKSEETDEFISTAVIQKAQVDGVSEFCCEALNSPDNPKLRNRCSQGRKKGSNLCHRHWNQLQKGKKTIVLFNE